MIKLIRPSKPKLLSKNEDELTKQFIDNNKMSVWNKKYILDPLAEMSHHKCCYCEMKFGEQSKIMSVDHFHYKNAYPNEVVLWDNLLPACIQCNSNKGKHNTYIEPIIDPTVDDPRDYLKLKFYRIISKDTSISSKGRLTVELLDLNNRERLVNARIRTADIMHIKLSDVLSKAYIIQSEQEVHQRTITRLKNTMYDILSMAQPDSEYSAFMATILLEDEDYKEIANIMKSHNLWTEELEFLHNQAERIKFE